MSEEKGLEEDPEVLLRREQERMRRVLLHQKWRESKKLLLSAVEHSAEASDEEKKILRWVFNK